MSKLLLDEPPIPIQPSLATAIGLNQSIAVQQLHWLMQNPAMGKVVDDKKYIRMTYEEWKVGHFPFWSAPTIQRVFDALEESGLVESRDDINQLHFDRTKWYTINYSKMDEVEESFKSNPRVLDHIKMKNGHIKMKDASDQNVITIPESSLPETSSESSTTESGVVETSPNIFKIYENEIGLITATIADELKDAEKEYPVDWIVEAIKISVANNKRSWSYAHAILKRWKANGKDSPPISKQSNPPNQSAPTVPQTKIDLLQQVIERNRSNGK